MILGILHFEVLVHGATSLKDKRRVVQSLKDRLHREHLCSIAEVGDPDILNCAVMGVAVVTRDGKRAAEVLDAISLKLRETRDAEVTSIRRHVLHALDTPEASDSDTVPDPKSGDGSDHDTDALMLDRALDADLLSQIEEAQREIERSLGADASHQGDFSRDSRRSA
ncbi:MAG TPA: DUF503 domain-containing protein [Phycisphaerales bacterium]